MKENNALKDTVKKILCSVLFILILILLFYTVSYLFEPRDEKHFILNDVQPNGVLAEEDNTLDVLLFGDSETFSAFSPVLMWDEQGFTSYVSASSSQYISLTESFVHSSLEHQKPKVIILETNCFFRKMTSDNDILTKVEHRFSIIKYHNRWKEFIPLSSNEETRYTWQDDLKGYTYITITAKGSNKEYMKKTDKVEPIPKTNEKIIKNICAYCKSKGVKVLFVSTSSSRNWNYKRHNAIVKLAKETGADYYDMNLQKDIGIDWSTDTADGGDHLNYKGAKKESSALAKYLKENYSLPDHRGDANDESWTELIEHYNALEKLRNSET